MGTRAANVFSNSESSDRKRPPVFAPLIWAILPVLLLVLFFRHAVFADTLNFTDAAGGSAVRVEPGGEVEVILRVSDAVDLSGFQARIIVSGPAEATGSAAIGEWFSGAGSVVDASNPAMPADFQAAMLQDLPGIAGSGDIAVFTVRALGDGVATVSLDTANSMLFASDGTPIPAAAPPVFTITIGTGAPRFGAPVQSAQSNVLAATANGGGEMLLLELTCPLIVGDVNRDLAVNVLDLILVRNHLNQNPNQDLETFRCDVNGDGYVNVLDTILVRDRLYQQVPIAMKGWYGIQSVETIDSIPSVTLNIDSEPDGETLVLFKIPGWHTSELDWSARCTCAGGCSAISLSGGVATLIFTHALDWYNAETHEVTFTASVPETCGRAVLVKFCDDNAYITIQEAVNGVVYAPVWAVKTVTPILSPACPPGGHITWQSHALAEEQPANFTSTANLQAESAGTYNLSVSYTFNGVTRTRRCTFAGFVARLVKAVRPDLTETTEHDIFTTPGTVHIYAEIYPPVPGPATWTWASQLVEPQEEYTTEFGFTGGQATPVSWTNGSATLTISGYSDGFDLQVNASAETNYGSAVMRPGSEPHVLVPTVAVAVRGYDTFYCEDPRIPCSGTDGNPGNPLYFGAPNVIELAAPVSVMRVWPDPIWTWTLPTGDAFLEPDGGKARLHVSTSTAVAIAVDITVDGVAVYSCTIYANIWSYSLPARTLFAGLDRNVQGGIENSAELKIPLDTATMPASLRFICNGWYRPAVWEGGVLKLTITDPGHGFQEFSTERTVSGGIYYDVYNLYRAAESVEVVPLDLRAQANRKVYRLVVDQGGSSGVDQAELQIKVFCDPDVHLQSESVPGTPLEYTFDLTTKDMAGNPFSGCQLTVDGSAATLTLPAQAYTQGSEALVAQCTLCVELVPDGLQGYETTPGQREIVFDVEYYFGDGTYGNDTLADAEEFLLVEPWAYPFTPIALPKPAQAPPEAILLGGGETFSPSPMGPGSWDVSRVWSYTQGSSTAYYPAYYRIIVFQVDIDPYGDMPHFAVHRNDDDDDANGTPDFQQGTVAGEDDLRRVEVIFKPPLQLMREAGMRLEVVPSQNLSLWGKPDKSAAYGYDVPPELSSFFYIEGTAAGPGTVTVKLVVDSPEPLESVRAINVPVLKIDVRMLDPEAEPELYRTLDKALFATNAPTLRIDFGTDVSAIVNRIRIEVDDGNDATPDVWNITSLLSFNGSIASGTIPAPTEEQYFGYYIGRSRTRVRVLHWSTPLIRNDSTSFHYILDEDEAGNAEQFIQHQDISSRFIDVGSDRLVKDIVIAHFQTDITDQRISEIMQEGGLVIVGLERDYQTIVVKVQPGQDQQEVRDYLASLPDTDEAFIPGMYDYDPETGEYDDFGATGCEGSITLMHFVKDYPFSGCRYLGYQQGPLLYAISACADATVANGAEANTNFGDEPALAVDFGLPPDITKKLSYLKFDIRNVSKLIGPVTLNMVLVSKEADTVDVYGVLSDAWEEDTITFATAPGLNPDGSLDAQSVVAIRQVLLPEADNQPVEIDVTDFVHGQYLGDRIVTFVLCSQVQGSIVFESREEPGCAPYLYFDPEVLPDYAEAGMERDFVSIMGVKVHAWFNPLDSKWYDSQVLRDNGHIQQRLDSDGKAVEYIDWTVVPGNLALGWTDQATIFLSTKVAPDLGVAFSRYLQNQAIMTLEMLEYTDFGNITLNVLRGDFEGTCYALAAVAIPGMTGKSMKHTANFAVGRISGVTRKEAEKAGVMAMRRVAKNRKFKDATLSIGKEVRKWEPGKWGFDGIFRKGDKLIAQKATGKTVLKDGMVAVFEAKGGSGKLGGLMRDGKWLQQMGQDGKWVDDVIRRMGKSNREIDRVMAGELMDVKKQGKLLGFIVNTPIIEKVPQVSKVIKFLFNP
ncbi:MAG TPA: DNRLRE domain-containing protein [Planctomycetota bacterium]|nr:DNRLRE domain-containing protein [Planctomycetota bacterium]